MSKHDKLRGISFGPQSTAGTPVDPFPPITLDPSDPALVPQLQANLAARYAHLRTALTAQYRTGGFIVAGDPSVYVPPADPAWPPVDADPWAPAVPTAYQYSSPAQDRKAVFNGAPGTCLRCNRGLDGCGVVAIAPPGLPRAVVHLCCLEVGDQVQPRPEAP